MLHAEQIEQLLNRMTLAEKIGQMRQVHGCSDENKALARKGEVGSFINVMAEEAEELQRIATQESRLGIPLLFGRDVIHGFKTVFPIPLGQAAAFNPQLASETSRAAAREAASHGIHWTFAPMLDIARDPRWGRIAESCGEDPYLTASMAAAMTRGFQGPLFPSAAAGEDGNICSIAACAKHYVGYGAAEAGRDYNTTLIPERTLRNVYLPPFQACVAAGVASVMSAFNDLNDIPASGNEFTIRHILKGEWRFDGLVVSDWAAITEMINHGYCADSQEAALAAIRAGVDMEMVSTAYADHLAALVETGKIPLSYVDDAVRRILRVKLRLGLFDGRRPRLEPRAVIHCQEHLAIAYRSALESCVLLQNQGVLPLAHSIKRLAVIGPLADSPVDQMGCWTPDGNPRAVRTPLAVLREKLGAERIIYEPGLQSCRDQDKGAISQAVAAAHAAEAVVAFVGEDAMMSGEAHCRAFLDLPGSQIDLLTAVASAGKPIAAVVMAGRPLLCASWREAVGAILWAWHPGTMGGPAIADLLFGNEAPSGRLPVSFPRAVGQIPIYYNQKNTGRPPPPTARGAPTGTPLDPKDFTSRHMDVDVTPEFPFGFGLTYTEFQYSGTRLANASLKCGERTTATASITNIGKRRAAAVAQLYIRDLAASATRPVRELKGFRKIDIDPGASVTVSFDIGDEELAFYDAQMRWCVEPGRFLVWIAPDSTCAGIEPAVLTVG